MHWPIRNPLPQPLMGSGLIEVDNISFEKPAELLLMKNQEMIQAFSPHAPQKAFADGIGLRRLVGRTKHFDATCYCHSCKIQPEFPVVISNQIGGCLSVRSCLSQLLRYPGISRRARYIHMDDSPRLQFDDEEGKKRTEEEVPHLQEITRPHLGRMIAEKRLPLLSTRSFSTNVPHILLNSSFTDSNIQLEKLAPNALRSPEPIVCCHLLDQADRLGGESLHPRSGFRFAPPK